MVVEVLFWKVLYSIELWNLTNPLLLSWINARVNALTVWIFEIITNNLFNQVCKGILILFYKDIWVNSQSLKQLFPRLYLISTQQWSYCILDISIWNDRIWEWNLKWRRRIFVWEYILLTNIITLINRYKPSIDMEDKVIWKESQDKQYHVRSFTQLANDHMFQRKLPHSITSFIW